MKTSTVILGLDEDVLNFLASLGNIDLSQYVNQVLRKHMDNASRTGDTPNGLTDLLQRHTEDVILGAD